MPGRASGGQRKPSNTPQEGSQRGPQASSKRDYRKTALSNASAVRSQAASVPVPNSDENELATQLAAMTVSGTPVSNPNVYNPSMGPSPSMMTMATANAPSVAGSRASRFVPGKAFHNAVCKLSGRTRKDFSIGQITPIEVRNEYMDLINEGQPTYERETNLDPLKATLKKPLKEKTVVHVTGGIKVACNEDISIVRTVVKKSYRQLKAQWDAMRDEANQMSSW